MTEQSNGPKRSRLETEIDEILAKSNRPIPISAKARSNARNIRGRILSLRANIGWIDTTWGWFAIALVLFFVGGAITGSEGVAWQLIRWVGLGAFVLGVVRLFRPTYRSTHKTWRGRVIDMRRPGVELGDRFDDWRKRR